MVGPPSCNKAWRHSPPPAETNMAVRVAVHQPSPDSTQAVWLDSTPDLSCTNSTQANCVDVEHQPTDLAVGGSNPSRRAIRFPPVSWRGSGPGWHGLAFSVLPHAPRRLGWLGGLVRQRH